MKLVKYWLKIVTGNIKSQHDTFTVYDPTMGSGSLLLTVRNEIPDGSRQGAVSFLRSRIKYSYI